MDRKTGLAGTHRAFARCDAMTSEPVIAEWFRLTRDRMPSAAPNRDWPVRFDHCFQRILLDNAVGGKWTETIPAPAYRNAGDTLLAKAVTLGKQVMAGELDLAELNRKSLDWRDKSGPKIAS